VVVDGTLFGSTDVVVLAMVVVVETVGVGMLLGSMVVVVTAAAVVVVAMVVDVVTVGTVAVVVVVSRSTKGAAGVGTGGAVVSGTDGKRSANVVGRQAAWAGATATTDTKRAQAKKSVVARVLKVHLKLPARGCSASLKKDPPASLKRPAIPSPGPPSEGGASPPPGSRQSP
jgi:hypothetical protein